MVCSPEFYPSPAILFARKRLRRPLFLSTTSLANRTRSPTTEAKSLSSISGPLGVSHAAKKCPCSPNCPPHTKTRTCPSSPSRSMTLNPNPKSRASSKKRKSRFRFSPALRRQLFAISDSAKSFPPPSSSIATDRPSFASWAKPPKKRSLPDSTGSSPLAPPSPPSLSSKISSQPVHCDPYEASVKLLLLDLRRSDALQEG